MPPPTPPTVSIGPVGKADPAANVIALGTRRGSTGGKGALAPSSFYCPISMELMGDPCMLATGHTYERVRHAGCAGQRDKTPP